MKYVVMKCLMLICVISVEAHDTAWTWTYRNVVHISALQNGHKTLVINKENTPLFNQLVFSWNAFRPRDPFTFYVSIHDAHTKTWSEWYRMAEWGVTKQVSHKSPQDTPYNYVYVRMETNKQFADGYKLKIQVADKRDAALLHSCSVCISNLSLFDKEDSATLVLPSIQIKGVPTFSQFAIEHPKNDALCSPTSCSMLVSYLQGSLVDPLEFAEHSFDSGLGVYGSWPFNTAHAFEMAKGRYSFEVTRLPSFKQLHAYLIKKIPVIVSVRGPLVGSATPYAGGHLLVVVGWDNATKEVICHDPAFFPQELVVKKYPAADFLLAWERSRRLAYVARKNESKKFS